MAVVDYEGSSKEAYVQRPDADRYNVVGTFPSNEAAGRAVEQLRSEGFGNADVRLIGSPDDAIIGGAGMTDHDVKVVGSSMRWGIAGTAGGAVLGAAIGLVVMAIPAFQSALGIHASGGSYALAALFGAIIGSALGLAGGILGLDRSHSGVSTYNEQRATSTTMVGVHAEDSDRTGAAALALQRAGAVGVNRVEPGQKLVIPPPPGS